MNYYAIDSNRCYLAHHGIKGQKWGVRNYQYEDGSYTPAGKRRYGIMEGPRGLMRTGRSAYGRHFGRVTTNMARPFHAIGRDTKNYVRSVRNTHGIKKVATLTGHPTREAFRAHAANARDEAKISRDIAGSYHGKNLYSTYQRRKNVRAAELFDASSRGGETYARSRDKGESIINSYINTAKDFFTSDMTSWGGRKSTVGKEIVKDILVTAGTTAATNIIRNRNKQ